MTSNTTAEARKRMLQMSRLLLSEKMGAPSKPTGAKRKESDSLKQLRDHAVASLRKPGARSSLR
ncbi:hypothetical protein [Phaeobacter sp. HF9A]|uniref:hypothetical protein n=1 Tax=Phaeobacter sp. HF9A TaxID=2721561 RepID=UPI001430BD64|nr:hypothetical protein [Phaeobacter sp. HF9A]NIZ14933.1 hypothetical protein [Phaeobacter sp. HF9A]